MEKRDVRIVAFGGSLREHSLNSHLLRAAATIARDICEIEVVDVAGLPMYNQDYDPGLGGEELPVTVVPFHKAVERSDGILLVSPEYNWSVPGYLKNAVDWVSHPARDSVMVGRPVLLMGASIGPAGTVRAQLAWRQILLSMKTPVLFDSLQVPLAHTRIDPDGSLDAVLSEQVASLMAALVQEAALARALGLPNSMRRPSNRPVAGVYPRNTLTRAGDARKGLDKQ